MYDILNGDKIDLCIDDGLHTPESQINTYNYFKQYMNGVYIIEDIDKDYDMTKKLNCIQDGRIAVIK